MRRARLPIQPGRAQGFAAAAWRRGVPPPRFRPRNGGGEGASGPRPREPPPLHAGGDPNDRPRAQKIGAGFSAPRLRGAHFPRAHHCELRGGARPGRRGPPPPLAPLPAAPAASRATMVSIPGAGFHSSRVMFLLRRIAQITSSACAATAPASAGASPMSRSGAAPGGGGPAGRAAARGRRTRSRGRRPGALPTPASSWTGTVSRPARRRPPSRRTERTRTRSRPGRPTGTRRSSSRS